MDPTEPISTPAESARTRVFRTRWRSGIAMGAGIGLALGVGAGAVVAWIVGGGTAAWMAFVGCVVAGIAIGLFVGGLSRLESPQPGEEPSQVDRPVLDEPELTKTEQGRKGS